MSRLKGSLENDLNSCEGDPKLLDSHRMSYVFLAFIEVNQLCRASFSLKALSSNHYQEVVAVDFVDIHIH